MQRFFLTLLIGFLTANTLLAQQAVAYSFYRHNWAIINPAAFPREHIEMRDMNIFATLNLRQQVQAVSTGAPRSLDGRAELIFEGKGKNAPSNKLLLGVQVDEAGALANTDVKLGYAWMGKLLSDDVRVGFLALGGSVDLVRQSVRTDAINWQTPANVPSNFINQYMAFNLGAFYYLGIHPEAEGRALPKRIERQNEDKEPFLAVGASFSQFEPVGNLNWTKPRGQVNILLNGGFWHIEPSVWLRFVPQSRYLTTGEKIWSGDFNLRYSYKWFKPKGNLSAIHGDKIWLGFGSGTAALLNMELGFRHWFLKNVSMKNKPNYLQIGVSRTWLPLNSNAFQGVQRYECHFIFGISR